MISSPKHSRGWENSRKLCKSSTFLPNLDPRAFSSTSPQGLLLDDFQNGGGSSACVSDTLGCDNVCVTCLHKSVPVLCQLYCYYPSQAENGLLGTIKYFENPVRCNLVLLAKLLNLLLWKSRINILEAAGNLRLKWLAFSFSAAKLKLPQISFIIWKLVSRRPFENEESRGLFFATWKFSELTLSFQESVESTNSAPTF